MNIVELKRHLDTIGINRDFYSLEGALLPDRIVLYKNYDKWEVFYLDELGNREKHRIFLMKVLPVNIFMNFSKDPEDYKGHFTCMVEPLTFSIWEFMLG